MYHTLWVCASKKEVIARRRTFGNSTNVLFISAGAALCGTRFDEIIVDNMYADAGDSRTLYERIFNWFEDDVRCRLTPKGAIKFLTNPLRWKL